MINGRPNLFEFATSELSHDAILAWLLEWANSTNQEIDLLTHNLGVEFLNLIYQKHELTLPEGDLKIKVRMKFEKIDVLAEVNDKEIVLIENKVGTKEHSDQLERYVRSLEKKFENAKIIPTYVQTLEQSSYSNVLSKGYKVVNRGDLIYLLNRYVKNGGSNDIAIEFYFRLNALEKDFSKYLTQPLSNWGWYAWQGFYRDLQRKLNAGNWGYVPNQSGGFLGFWWGHQGYEDVDVYLQIEQNSVCFKISTDGDTNQKRKNRNKWHRLIMQSADELGLKVKKPYRFGNGYTMTVAVLAEEYRVMKSNQLIDLTETVTRLKKLEEVINRAVSKA